MSLLVVICVPGGLAVFRDDAQEKIEIGYSTTVRRGIVNYDYTKLEVEATLLEMVDQSDSIDRENVRLEFMSSESDWTVLDQKPTMKGGVYKWTISDIVPCHNHNVRLTVFSAEGREISFDYPETILAASKEDMIKSRYRPSPPQDVRVEEMNGGHKVTWSPSHCADTYDLSYRMVGHSDYTTKTVESNFAIISETLEICEEFEVLLSAVLGDEYSDEQTVTFTSAPDDNVSDRLEPEVEVKTNSAIVRWKGSEKLSCIPSYQVQLCDREASNCEEKITMDRDDSVKFMEFSSSSPLEMCSAYSLYITPLSDQLTVKPKIVEFQTLTQPLEDVTSQLGPVEAELGEDQTVSVSWSSVPCAEDYIVYQKERDSLEWTWLANTRDTTFTHNTKACTAVTFAVSAVVNEEESEKVESVEIITDVNKAELPVIEVVEKANGSMIFRLRTGDLNTLCEVDRLHIKYAGGEEFLERASLESDKITIDLREEGEKVEGRLHYSSSQEDDWSPWASSDAPTMEKQTLQEMNFLLPIIIGSVVALALIITVIFLVLKSKKGQAKYDSEKANGNTDESKKLNESSEEKIINGKK